MSNRDGLELDGAKLLYYREHHVPRLTQGQLEAKTGISQAHISRLENGEEHDVKLSTLNALAEALEVPFFELLKGAREQLITDPCFQLYGKDILNLTPEERRSVQEYVRFINQRKQ